MKRTRRDLLKNVVGSAVTAAAMTPFASPIPAWGRGGPVPTEADYFDGTAVDHGVEYRRTNMALIPKAYRPQITAEISDPEPGRIVVDTREHFLYDLAREAFRDMGANRPKLTLFVSQDDNALAA